jgi:hypothetical protein
MNGNPNIMHFNFSSLHDPKHQNLEFQPKPLDMGLVKHINIRPCHPFYFSNARSKENTKHDYYILFLLFINKCPYATKNNYGYNVLM